MNYGKQLAHVIDQLIIEKNHNIEGIDNDTIDEYRKLHDKCNKVLERIKKRKINK